MSLFVPWYGKRGRLIPCPPSTSTTTMIQTTPAVNLLKDEGAYRVLAAAQAIEKTGKKVVHLEIGQPGFPTPKYIAEVGQRAIADGFTTYVNPSGTMEIKEAIANHIRETRNLAAVTADNVVVGPGAKPGLFFAAQAVISAGDEVLIPDPGFPTYENLVKLFGGVAVRYNALSATIASEVGSKLTPKTRLIILNSPSNPTGRIFSRQENKHLADELRKFPAVWIVSDEIYCHLIYEDNNDAFATAPSIIGEPGMQDRTIIIDGFSKTFSMTGWRLGFAICNAELAKKLHLLMTHAVGCTASFSQRAGTVALTQKEDMRREVGGPTTIFCNVQN